MLWLTRCLQCRRPHKRALCDSCWAQIEPMSDPCPRCSLPLSPEQTCPDCPRLQHALHHRAYTLYQGPVQGLIYQIKYHDRPQLAQALGSYLGQWLQGSQADILVPIPLHAERLAQRGYNQAERLAQGIGQVLHIPVMAALARNRATEALHNLRLPTREAMLREAFSLTPVAQQLSGKKVLLVDDIVTTGATLQEAYQLLSPSVSQLGSVSLARTNTFL